MNEAELQALVRSAGDEETDATHTAVRSAIVDALQGGDPRTPLGLDRQPPAPSWNRRWLLVAAAIVVVALVVGVAALRRTSTHSITPASDAPIVSESVPESTPAPTTAPPTETAVAVAPTTTPATATTVAVTQTDPATTTSTTTPPVVPVGPAHVQLPPWFTAAPDSVDWVTPLEGWVKPFTESHGGSLSLLHTVDGGQTWAIVDTNVQIADDNTAMVRFADDRNGWIINGAALYSTHDGGSTWNPVVLGGGNNEVMDIAVGAGRVHVVAADTNQSGSVLFVAPIDSDAFVQSPVVVRFGAGPVYDGQLVVAGDRGWFLYGDRGLVGAARLVDGTWVDWTPPCPPNSDAVASSGDAARLVVACSTNGFYGPPYEISLVASQDGGDTYTPLTSPSAPTDTNEQVLFLWQPSDGSIVMGYRRADQSTAIVRSADGGATWTTVHEFGVDEYVVGSFEIAGVGFSALTNIPGAVASYDGGQTWEPVALGTITGT